MSDVPLYRRFLGDRFNELSPALQVLHDVEGVMVAHGQAEITAGGSILSAIARFLFGLPPAGTCAITMSFTPDGDREVWSRSFGGHDLSSIEYLQPSENGPLLVEKVGLISVAQEPVLEGGSLSLVIRRWRFCGMPLPLSLAPRSQVLEVERDGRFTFDVALSHPLTGPITRYRGWLVPVEAKPQMN